MKKKSPIYYLIILHFYRLLGEIHAQKNVFVYIIFIEII